jgi:hypothetical protein
MPQQSDSNDWTSRENSERLELDQGTRLRKGS